ncbi:MAG TPA: YhjD/YihY/BrkB family envelope integrity protein, partial [Archangium sp.]
MYATLAAFTQDRVATMAAALSYYTFFSIAPLILIAIAIAGAIFGDEAARGALSANLTGIVGERTANVVESLV